jgi:TctA family transporter
MPNEITSASESSSRPSGDDWWRQRATRPSITSKNSASGAIAAAMKKCTREWVPTVAAAKNTISAPQAALARVKKSARWNPRIIEKCFMQRRC